jgi:hypothetical protein
VSLNSCFDKSSIAALKYASVPTPHASGSQRRRRNSCCIRSRQQRHHSVQRVRRITRNHQRFRARSDCTRVAARGRRHDAPANSIASRLICSGLHRAPSIFITDSLRTARAIHLQISLAFSTNSSASKHHAWTGLNRHLAPRPQALPICRSGSAAEVRPHRFWESPLRSACGPAASPRSSSLPLDPAPLAAPPSPRRCCARERSVATQRVAPQSPQCGIGSHQGDGPRSIPLPDTRGSERQSIPRITVRTRCPP